MQSEGPATSPAEISTPVTAFVSINCHPFHKLDLVKTSVFSVARAISHYRANSADTVLSVFFWHGDDPVPAHLLRIIHRLGLTVSNAPHVSNGDNLNRQIEHADRESADLFFRVDADDAVTSDRFLNQSLMLKGSDCDMCGGALHYRPESGPQYVTQVARNPGPSAYLENRFLLHPTMAFRVSSFRAANLRYWPFRLEDKAMLMEAYCAGLRIKNMPQVLGDYTLTNKTRTGFYPKFQNLRLNLRFIHKVQRWDLIAYALLLFAAQIVIGPEKLRYFRSLRNVSKVNLGFNDFRQIEADPFKQKLANICFSDRRNRD